ncbi:MAG: ABC transporter substrate-binding protein [Candidatus Thorarchaeota archaeon]|nr:ABC transporter substrate-binding protein [Candidatus Thorarchaeota archaeon]
MSEFETGRDYKTIMIAVVVIAIIAVGGIAGFILLGGGGSTTTTTEPEGLTLTILTRHDVAIHNVFEPAFLASDEAEATGITDILWKTPAEAFWDDLLELGQADVCWGGGPTLFDQIMRDDYLSTWDTPGLLAAAATVNDTLAGADMKRYDGDDLKWVAAAISTFGFTVNHQFLDDYSLPTPSTWTDLANTTYGNLLPAIPTIAMGNAPDTTSNTRIYQIITQALGWDAGWINIARMAGSSNIYTGSVETQQAAERGDVGIAMSIDFYGYLSQYRNPDCEYILPEGQSIVNGDPIAIAETSSHKDLAEVFVEFVLSDYGQSLWLDASISRMPVRIGAFDSPGAPQDLKSVYTQTVNTVGIEFNDTLTLYQNTALLKYFEAVFTDAHTELRQCWGAIVGAFYDGHISAAQVDTYADLMGIPVTIQDPNTSTMEKFTLAYAMEINNDLIYNSDFGNSMQSLWTAAAKAQYLDVYNQIQALLP